MPKALEDKLRKEAASKGMTGRQADAYVYGTMRKTGWVPSTQKKRGITKKRVKQGVDNDRIPKGQMG